MATRWGSCRLQSTVCRSLFPCAAEMRVAGELPDLCKRVRLSRAFKQTTRHSETGMLAAHLPVLHFSGELGLRFVVQGANADVLSLQATFEDALCVSSCPAADANESRQLTCGPRAARTGRRPR